MGLGSGVRDPEKTYSGSRSRGQKGTGSRIRIRITYRNSVLRVTLMRIRILLVTLMRIRIRIVPFTLIRFRIYCNCMPLNTMLCLCHIYYILLYIRCTMEMLFTLGMYWPFKKSNVCWRQPLETHGGDHKNMGKPRKEEKGLGGRRSLV
jgi:hypothetical protein